MRIAEEGFKIALNGQTMVQCKLGTIVERDGAAKRCRQFAQQLAEAAENRLCRLGWLAADANQAGAPFVHDQHGLAVFAKQHEVSFPMPWFMAGVGAFRSLAEGDTVFDEVDGTGTPPAEPATAVLVAPQQMVPVVLLGGPMIDETIDGLMADDGVTMQVRQSAGDLLGRPSHRKAVADEASQGGLARQFVATAAPAPAPGEPDGAVGLVLPRWPVPGGEAVAAEFAADRAGCAQQDDGDLAGRSPGAMQPIDRLALCIAELLILGSHRNAILTTVLRLVRELKESIPQAQAAATYGCPLARA